jgi:serine/threonine protein kinase
VDGTKPISGAMSPGTLVLGDRFKVVKLLGGGGMGEVYVAEQLSLGRKVALKVLRSEMGQVHGMSERFRREAMLLSSVDHPAVVRVIEFGESNGAACLVMDLVEGETLEAVLRNAGPLPARRAQNLLRQLAEGLAAVHARGIVHRDLKPQNVIICEGPLGEQARLLDFGIARLTENDVPGGGVTQAGIVIGTPEYLSPEQAVAGKFDDRSDLYSFGVLAYHMLSMKLPLPGPSAREYIIQHATMPPTPLLQVAPQLAEHPVLAGIVMQCLEKRPEDRPRSAAAIAQSLLLASAGTPSGPIEVSPSMLMPSGATAAERPGAGIAPPVPTKATPVVPISSPGAMPAGSPSGVGYLPTTASPSRDFVPTAPVAPTVKRPLPVKAIGIGAAVLALVGGAVVIGPKLFTKSDVAEAQRMLDEGLSEDALRFIDAAQRKEGNKKIVPQLLLLKGDALHELKRHEEEWEALNKVPNSELPQMSGRVFRGLMEDFGGGSREQALTRLLDRPLNDKGLKEKFRPRAEELVKETPVGELLHRSALRYWELLGGDKGDVSEAYVAELRAHVGSNEGTDCEIKDQTARRLGALGDSDAIDALQEVVDSPRRPGFFGIGSDCGHREAEAAINRLKKEK